MRIAIYSRGIENNQHKDITLLLEELATRGVEPVFYQDFFNQFYSAFDIKGKYSTFNSSDDLDESREASDRRFVDADQSRTRHRRLHVARVHHAWKLHVHSPLQ